MGGFAIGARVSLLWRHSPNVKCQRVLVRALCHGYDVVVDLARSWTVMLLRGEDFCDEESCRCCVDFRNNKNNNNNNNNNNEHISIAQNKNPQISK